MDKITAYLLGRYCNTTDISASPHNNGAALPTPLLQQKGMVVCYQQKITEDPLYSE